MTFLNSFSDRFSPYLDPDPWLDFFDDFASRYTSLIGTVIAIHVAMFFMLQPNFIMPDLIEDEPEAIPVQIIAFEDLPAEPAPPEEIIELRPATPAPPPPPKVKPKPKPTPPPPPPLPEPEPEPEPEIAPPPPPEILSAPAPEPVPEAIPEPLPLPPPPEPEPEPLPEPVPVPEVFPEISYEVMPPEPEPEPIIETQELPPLPEPEPLPTPEPEPIIEIFEPAPLPELPPEPQPYVSPEPIITPPTPGPIIEEPLPDLPDINDLPPLPPLPEPEPMIEAPPAPPVQPEIIQPAPPTEAPIITTAPTILASPDAPTTSEEAEKAVPQSQAAPITDFLLKKPGSSGSQSPATGLGQPSGGLPRASSGSPPGGGMPYTGATQRTNPGVKGWTLTPRAGNDVGEGYKGLLLDIRCREAGKTHLDCPEYLRKFQGRNASGFEAFGSHAPTTPTGSQPSPRAGTYKNPAIGGGSDIWSQGIGDNSVNNGGPSTTVLDDADFGREFLGTNLGDGTDPQTVRDMFREPAQPWNDKPIELPPPPPPEDE